MDAASGTAAMRFFRSRNDDMRACALYALMAGTALLASCASMNTMRIPDRPDLSADIPEPAYKNLTAAIVDSENTKRTQNYLHRMNLLQGGPFGPILDGDQIIRDFRTAIRRNFKSATTVARVEDAAQAKADVVVVLDLNASLPSTNFGAATMNARAIVLDRKSVV
jgi:hypothetical protein